MAERSIGLALGGGLVLGAAHIGVLKAMDELEIKPARVLGISVGSLIGALYCCGKTPAEIEDIAVELSWWDLASISISKMGLLSNWKMGALIEKHNDGKSIENLYPPFTAVATNVTNGHYRLFEEGNLAQAVRASSAIPGIFHPVELDGEVLVDGGTIAKAMYEPLQNRGLDYIIAVDVQAHQPLKRPYNLIDTMYNAFEIMIEELVVPEHAVDMRIAPNLEGFSRTDTTQTKQIIDRGYETAIRQLEPVAAWVNNLE